MAVTVADKMLCKKKRFFRQYQVSRIVKEVVYSCNPSGFAELIYLLKIQIKQQTKIKWLNKMDKKSGRNYNSHTF